MYAIYCLLCLLLWQVCLVTHGNAKALRALTTTPQTAHNHHLGEIAAIAIYQKLKIPEF